MDPPGPVTQEGWNQVMIKKRFALAGVAAMLGALALAATAAAGGPMNGQGAAQPAADALKLTRDQVMELRQDGLSLAQIAEQQGVSTSGVVDALAARWTERIALRAENGALSEEQAAALQEQVREHAEAMVQQTDMSGMHGAAIGAGPANPNGAAAGDGVGSGVGPGPRGTGDGTGECDGTGPHGAGRP
jgi:hypothetical protein